jgi:hypothetical protein
MCGPTVAPLLLHAIKALLGVVLALIYLLAQVCMFILFSCGVHEEHDRDLD